MGSGHVMRCLTLADVLRAAGVDCHFISREHPGHLFAQIIQRGHGISMLPAGSDSCDEEVSGPVHARWLGVGWADDAKQTCEALVDLGADWLVVDHYAIDARWERIVSGVCRNMMVIDDLADRAHECDLLLDQNLGQTAQAYEALVPARCTVLAGAQFALLRPEFAELRAESLFRRAQAQGALRDILVTMGGVDAANASSYVLRALAGVVSPEMRITVVMGATAPWLAEVRQLVDGLPCTAEVLVNTTEMAKLMKESDLAIGAAGSTSWERCCMGLPTLMVVVADNQRVAGRRIEETGAAVSFSLGDERYLQELVVRLKESPAVLQAMSRSAAGITSGQGCSLVVEKLFEIQRRG